MSDVMLFMAIIGPVILVGLVISTIASFLMGHWSKSEFLKRVKIRLTHLRGPLFSLIPAACCMFALPFLAFEEKVKVIITRSIYLWLIASFGWFFVKGVYMIRETILKHYNIDVRDNLRTRRVYTEIGVIAHIFSISIILLTVSFILMTFSTVRQIGVSLLASAGVISIILGFAAQKTLGNLIAGIQIALIQPIRLDDAVVVENERGWIDEITLTYVVVRTRDLRRLILPVSYFIGKPFQNWAQTPDISGSVYLYVDYTVPVQKIREELELILGKSPYWDKKVNVLQVTNTSVCTVELRALMSAADSTNAWNLRCEVREKLLGFLQKNYPQILPRREVDLQNNY